MALIYQEQVDLTPYHNYKKRAGLASYFLNLQNYDLTFLDKCKYLSELKNKLNKPVRFYGSRTNLLITEGGYEGIFVFDENNNGNVVIQESENVIGCDGSVPLLKLVKLACEAGYDLGALAGIPGTVGAAVIGNSGAGMTGKYLGDYVKEITIYNLLTGRIEIIIPDKDYFSERNSKLAEANLLESNFIIVQVKFRVENVGRVVALKTFQERQDYRKKVNKEGYLFGTAGSFWANKKLPELFKKANPETKTRNLIVECGLDKLNINGARYTPNYCFLATEEKTKDRDVAELLKITKEKLEKEFKITPQKEVEVLDVKGPMTLDQYISKYLI